jgi:HEAT repeat protein
VAEALIEALKDPPLQRVVVGTLVRIGMTEKNAQVVVPLLIAVLKDENVEVRNGAAQTLKQIDPQAAAKAGVR